MKTFCIKSNLLLFKKILPLFIILLLNFSASYAQDDKFRALFLFNFSKNLEWTGTENDDNFVIAVYGNSPVIEELKIIAGQKKVGNQQIVVKKITNLSEMQQVKILYVPTNKSGEIKEIHAACQGKKTLLVTEKPGLAKTYAGINFYYDNAGKLSYEINQQNIKNQGIKISPMIVQLGTSVN